MINKISFLFVAARVTGAACNSETRVNPEIQATSNTKDEKPVAQNACYRSFYKRDTVTLSLDVNNNKVTGNLVYNLFEKDKNGGTINGQMKGDTLLAEYSFISEGINSVRGVAFLKKGNDLVEGYSDMAEKNGKLVFKNSGSINFESKIVLMKEDCIGK